MASPTPTLLQIHTRKFSTKSPSTSTASSRYSSEPRAPRRSSTKSSSASSSRSGSRTSRTSKRNPFKSVGRWFKDTLTAIYGVDDSDYQQGQRRSREQEAASMWWVGFGVV
ncbi:hypothetical protein B0A55_06966 [Friedmanniomyces simplex]|uniref:Uncharacterized protein n=1 Tax=Friedmanniomyces simplex TaxID=329884 RepID=A0A4U0X877_9PEZI|nr:hypothetical protein B0A55_06966 [Friedmanniomyces simplex]